MIFNCLQSDRVSSLTMTNKTMRSPIYLSIRLLCKGIAKRQHSLSKYLPETVGPFLKSLCCKLKKKKKFGIHSCQQYQLMFKTMKHLSLFNINQSFDFENGSVSLPLPPPPMPPKIRINTDQHNAVSKIKQNPGKYLGRKHVSYLL